MQLLQIGFLFVISIGVAHSWPIPEGLLNDLTSKKNSVADTRDLGDENQKDLNDEDSVLNRKPRDNEHACSSTEPESIASDERLKVINQQIVKKNNNQPEDDLKFATQIQKRDTYERKLYTFYIGSMLINIIMLAILMATCMKIMKLAVNKSPKEQAKIGKPCPTKCKKDCSHAVKLPPNDDFKDFDPPIKDCTCLTSEARTINFDKEEMNEEYGKCNEQTPFLKTLEGLTGKIPVGKSNSIKKGLDGDCIECNNTSSSHTGLKEYYELEVQPAKSQRITTDRPYKFLGRKRVASWQGYQTNKSESFVCDMNSIKRSNSKNSGSSIHNGNDSMTRSQMVAQIDMAGRIIMIEQMAGVEEVMPVVEDSSFKSFSDNESD